MEELGSNRNYPRTTENNGNEINLDETCGFEINCGFFKHKRSPCFSFQRFATNRWALFFFSIGGFIQGFLVNGHTPAIISTLEKRFALSSTASGLIASCYDIAGSLAILFVTYVGGRGHKPLWVGWGMFLVGLSGIIFSLPHFTAPTYSFIEQPNLCGNSSTASCAVSDIQNYRFVFYGAMLLAGVGTSPLFTLGITYLDENVKQRYSALYNGILIMMSIIGPGFGYLAGGGFLSYFTYPDADVAIDETSSNWVGAWWIGAIVFGFVGIFSALPILMLPRVIPGTEQNRLERENEMHCRAEENEGEDFGKSFRDFPKCVQILFRNPTFVFQSLAIALDSLLIGGLAVFGAKYMEVQFGIDASSAGTYFGILTILGGAGGQFTGGALISKFNIRMRWMLHMCYIAPLICVVASFCFLITCSQKSFAGIISLSNSQAGGNDFGLPSVCDTNCNCPLSVFDPVCGSDQMSYHSPCFAGCKGRLENGKFTNCSCILSVDSIANGTATSGTCIDEHCSSGWEIVLFSLCVLALMFFTFFNESSGLQVSLRCVAFNRRSFALGLQVLILRILGTIPGPLVVGAIFDRACLYWSNECGREGSCLAYNSSSLGFYLFTFVGIGKLVDVGLFLAAFCTYKPNSVELQKVEQSEQNLSDSMSGSCKDDNEQAETIFINDKQLRKYSRDDGIILSKKSKYNESKANGFAFTNITFQK